MEVLIEEAMKIAEDMDPEVLAAAGLTGSPQVKVTS